MKSGVRDVPFFRSLKLTRKTEGTAKGERSRKIFSRNLRLYLVILAVLILLGCLGFRLLRKALLENMQRIGEAVAGSFAAEEQNRLTVYETLLSYGAQNMDRLWEEGVDTERMHAWMRQYFTRVRDALGEDAVMPYAVIGGEAVAENMAEWKADYDYSETEWYRSVSANPGTAVFSDVYSGSASGRPVITAAQQCLYADVTVAFDIYPGHLEFQSDLMELPEDTSFFLCDTKGTAIYRQTELQGYSEEEVDRYLIELIEGIRNGEYDRYDSYIYDLEHDRRNVYYSSMRNGWMIVITVPCDSILERLNLFGLLFGALVILCAFVVIFLCARDLRLTARAARTNETMRVLGNSYYALYRVDFEKNTYEMIKGSDHVRKRIPPSGGYDELLRVAGEVIEEKAYRDFTESFSSDNLSRLVAERIRDFGGDFLRLFDQEYKWVNVRVLFDEILAPTEAVLCFREVDQEKQRAFQEQKLLEEALENARRGEKAKQAFFSNMSHDMRTPLNAIIGLSRLAQEHRTEKDKAAGYLEKIRSSGQTLLKLVNDILDMSRMEQGKLVLNYQQYHLKECMEECAAPFALQAEAEKKKFSLSWDIRDACVMGAPFRMKQILNNLLSNAFKFTSEGDAICVSVKQFERRDCSQYSIEVKDTGIGMSEEFLPHLFEPYSREVRFSAKEISGTGLGMSIVKSLVTQMSGQIRAESRLGEGTVLTLVIPLEVVREEAGGKAGAELEAQEAKRPSAEKETEKREKDGKKFSLDGKRILLAEDNAINMEIATEILSLNGVLVTQAWNGEEAVGKFMESLPFSYDAVLMDMKMPKLDGCEAAKRIRKLHREDAKNVPIIAVTANAFAEDIAETRAAGMNAHISKPIDFSLLCSTLEELTGES